MDRKGDFSMTAITRSGFIAFLVLAGTFGATSHAADSIVGSWHLLSWVEVETESKSIHAVFGDNPTGVLTYTPDGRMSVLIIDPKRKLPGGPKPTDGEANDLYRTMLAYSGSYIVEGNTVTHKIEISWNQAWTGTSQQRFIELKENQLTIKTPPLIGPISGKESVSTLLWERIK
jgi:hypothetical protein